VGPLRVSPMWGSVLVHPLLRDSRRDLHSQGDQESWDQPERCHDEHQDEEHHQYDHEATLVRNPAKVLAGLPGWRLFPEAGDLHTPTR